MILFYRSIPFLVSIILAFVFALIGYFPKFSPFIVLFAASVIFILLGYMAQWRIRVFSFWNFVGTPFLLATSGMALFLFLNSPIEKIILSVVVTAVAYFYLEHLFAYLHAGAAHELHALEHITITLHILTVFFASAFIFGVRLFLNTQTPILALAVFLIYFYVLYSMLWAREIDSGKTFIFAFMGALISTEIFTASSFLPTSLYTFAAFLAVFVYTYLGISRSHLLNKLSPAVARRYVVLSSVLSFIIFFSARWV